MNFMKIIFVYLVLTLVHSQELNILDDAEKVKEDLEKANKVFESY